MRKETSLPWSGGDVKAERARYDVTQEQLAAALAGNAEKGSQGAWWQTLGLVEAGVLELSQEAYQWVIDEIHKLGKQEAA